MTDPHNASGVPSGDGTHPTRRTLLRTAGLVALAGGSAGGLVSCASAAESPPATPSTTLPGEPAGTSAPPTSAQPTSAPASSAPPGPASSTPEKAPPTKKAKPRVPSGPSVATADVPVGGGVVLKKADYVVTQPKKGTFKAFSKICTHRGCPVAAVRDGVIHCNCHGSEFSIKDGSVVNPPARKGLAEADVEVVGKKVYVLD
jgi:Rieske Fe-S protein